MSSDFHIKFDSVEGEATHKDHKGETELLNWSWSVSQESAFLSGGGSGKGKAVPGNFSFNHVYDKSSTVLAKKCVDGKHFKDAKLTASKAGDGQKPYLTITMKEVFITSCTPSARAGGDLIESVSFTFKDIEFEYKPQKSEGGLGGAVKFGWDVGTTETR